MSEILIVAIVSLIVMVTTIVLIYRTPLTRDLKPVLYVLAVLIPPIAIILYLIFYLRHRKNSRAEAET